MRILVSLSLFLLKWISFTKRIEEKKGLWQRVKPILLNLNKGNWLPLSLAHRTANEVQSPLTVIPGFCPSTRPCHRFIPWSNQPSKDIMNLNPFYQVWIGSTIRQAYSALPYRARQGCEQATELEAKRDAISKKSKKRALSGTGAGQGWEPRQTAWGCAGSSSNSGGRVWSTKKGLRCQNPPSSSSPSSGC